MVPFTVSATVIRTLPFRIPFFPDFTVIVTVPGLTPVTRPEALTVATDLSLEE